MGKSDETAKTEKKTGGFRVPKPAGGYSGHTDRLKSTLVAKATTKRRYARDLKQLGDEGDATTTDEFLKRSTAGAEREDASTSAPVQSSFVPRTRKGKEVAEPKMAMHPDRAARLSEPAPPRKKTKAELRAEEAARNEDERVRWNKRTARGAPDRASQMGVLLSRIERQLGAEKQ